MAALEAQTHKERPVEIKGKTLDRLTVASKAYSHV
jgi:hypothetical protein